MSQGNRGGWRGRGRRGRGGTGQGSGGQGQQAASGGGTGARTGHRINHRDKGTAGRIFSIYLPQLWWIRTSEPKTVQVREAFEDVAEEDEVAIAGDVLAAEAGDVKRATRAWLETARLRVLEPSQHLHIRRETSEAPDWPVQWTDGACTPELSKPIWRGSTIGEQDLIIADAEEEATQAETFTVSVCHFCGEGRDTSSEEVTQGKLLKTETACRGVEATPAYCTGSQSTSG